MATVPDSFAEAVAANAAAAKAIAERRDSDNTAVDRALEIVKAFIRKRGRILYGGQAIDYALRLRGAAIYPDHQRPDYDFFSPDSVGDAYDLAEELAAAGLPNVVAHNAVHVQTMRVKTDFVFVADISFAPPAVYESFPTLSYSGMRILHPDYQRSDMHLAFSFPLANPPREDLYHRFAKDLKRFNLFESYFPLSTGEALGAPIEGGTAPTTLSLDKVPLDKVAFHGVAAYAALTEALAALAAAGDALQAAGADVGDAVARARALDVPAARLAIEGPPASASVSLDTAGLPAPLTQLPVVLASPWPEAVAAAVGEGSPTPFAPYMDSRPDMLKGRAANGTVFEVYSTHNRLLAVSSFVPGAMESGAMESGAMESGAMESGATEGGATEGGAKKSGAPSALAVGNQYLLLYFLYQAHVAAGATRAAFVTMYRATLAVLEASDVLLAAIRDASGDDSAAAYSRLVDSGPFALSVETLGDANRSDAYLVNIAKSARQTGVEPPFPVPPVVVPPKLYAPVSAGAPAVDSSGKPPRNSTRPAPYDYEEYAAFMRDGRQL